MHPQIPRFVPGKKHGVEFWQQRQNQRAYFDWLGTKVGVKKLDDWYANLSTKLVQTNGGSTLLEISKIPLSKLLSNVYPEHEWVPWRFRVVPAGYWKDMSNQQKFMDWLGKSIGVEKMDDWYEHLSQKLFENNGGGSLLEQYGDSPLIAISTIYSHHNWLPWKFKCAPNGFWVDKTNHKKFFDWLGQQLNVKELDDWYQCLSQKIIYEHGGIGLLAYYNNSPIYALTAAYPHHDWKMWKFQSAPRDFWSNLEHQKQFFDWLGAQIGIKHWEDWYDKLSQSVVHEHGGRGLLALYSNSPALAISKVYPEHPWEVWRFKTVPSMFWKSKDNQKQFMEWLGRKLGVTKLDDWYNVISHKVLRDNGGSSLLDVYKSPFLILKSLYPEHRWIPWKFQSFTPRYFYKDKSLIQEWLAEVGQNLHVQRLDDWYRVSHKQLLDASALHVVKRYGGLYNMVSELYPGHKWERQKFADRSKRSSQRWLFILLQSLFPNDEVLENHLHRDMIFQVSQRNTELDIYIPSKALAFEYQGEQHYRDIGFMAPQQRYQDRDEEKQKQCETHNITLVQIPYWWDNKKDSLVATIRAARPDIQFLGIMVGNSAPIPAAPLHQA